MSGCGRDSAVQPHSLGGVGGGRGGTHTHTQKHTHTHTGTYTRTPELPAVRCCWCSFKEKVLGNNRPNVFAEPRVFYKGLWTGLLQSRKFLDLDSSLGQHVCRTNCPRNIFNLTRKAV